MNNEKNCLRIWHFNEIFIFILTEFTWSVKHFMHLFWCWCIMLEASGIFKWNYTFFHDFLSENVCCAIKFDGRAFCRNCFHNIQINVKVIKLQKEIVTKFLRNFQLFLHRYLYDNCHNPDRKIRYFLFKFYLRWRKLTKNSRMVHQECLKNNFH